MKEDRIRNRAYWLWRYKEEVGIPSTPEENWFEAERQEKALREHEIVFHREFDINA